MHKAIRLKVNLYLWIEAESDPASDFAALTTAALQSILTAGAAQYPNLAIKIDKIEEDRTEDEDS